MLDVRIDNVVIIDGAGSPAFPGSLGIKNGRIEAVGKVEASAATVIDGEGLTIMPGIIDNHTHYDAQITWDAYASPSPELGVTTLLMGNCGFTIAPCRPNDREITMRNLTQVEGMSMDALAAGIDWSFETFPQYLDMLEQKGVGPNVGCYVGHSSVRTYVLGTDASKRAATPEEIEQMREIVSEAIDAGACGFATTRSYQHNGEKGIPMPSRLANDDELLALSGVLKEKGRGTLMMTKASDTPMESIERLCAAAGRPYIVAALLHSALDPQRTFNDLNEISNARSRGNLMVGAVSPCPLNMEFTFRSPYPLEGFKVWSPLMSLEEDDYKSALANHSFRESFLAELNDGRVHVFSGDWDKVHVAQVATEENLSMEGCSIAELAEGCGKDPFDFMLDLALSENLDTVFTATMMNSDEEAIGKMMLDESSIISLSDAGAHLTFLCDAGFGLHVLGYWVRDQKLMSLEAAAKKLTFDNAKLFGIKDRGEIRVGAWADLLLFDPKTVGRGRSRRLYDLPSGASRLSTPSVGVHGVWINGHRVADSKGMLADLPLAGRVIREYNP